MPNDFSRDTLPEFALSFGVDGECEVGMGFDIDKSWTHHQALGINDFFGLNIQVLTHGHNQSRVHGHVNVDTW